eukprot:PhM_4_TR11889/c0_g1_i1/m.80318
MSSDIPLRIRPLWDALMTWAQDERREQDEPARPPTPGSPGTSVLSFTFCSTKPDLVTPLVAKAEDAEGRHLARVMWFRCVLSEDVAHQRTVTLALARALAQRKTWTPVGEIRTCLATEHGKRFHVLGILDTMRANGAGHALSGVAKDLVRDVDAHQLLVGLAPSWEARTLSSMVHDVLGSGKTVPRASALGTWKLLSSSVELFDADTLRHILSRYNVGPAEAIVPAAALAVRELSKRGCFTREDMVALLPTIPEAPDSHTMLAVLLAHSAHHALVFPPLWRDVLHRCTKHALQAMMPKWGIAAGADGSSQPSVVAFWSVLLRALRVSAKCGHDKLEARHIDVLLGVPRLLPSASIEVLVDVVAAWNSLDLAHRTGDLINACLLALWRAVVEGVDSNIIEAVTSALGQMPCGTLLIPPSDDVIGIVSDIINAPKCGAAQESFLGGFLAVQGRHFGGLFPPTYPKLMRQLMLRQHVAGGALSIPMLRGLTSCGLWTMVTFLRSCLVQSGTLQATPTAQISDDVVHTFCTIAESGHASVAAELLPPVMWDRLLETICKSSELLVDTATFLRLCSGAPWTDIVVTVRRRALRYLCRHDVLTCNPRGCLDACNGIFQASSPHSLNAIAELIVSVVVPIFAEVFLENCEDMDEEDVPPARSLSDVMCSYITQSASTEVPVLTGGSLLAVVEMLTRICDKAQSDGEISPSSLMCEFALPFDGAQEQRRDALMVAKEFCRTAATTPSSRLAALASSLSKVFVNVMFRCRLWSKVHPHRASMCGPIEQDLRACEALCNNMANATLEEVQRIGDFIRDFGWSPTAMQPTLCWMSTTLQKLPHGPAALRSVLGVSRWPWTWRYPATMHFSATVGPEFAAAVASLVWTPPSASAASRRSTLYQSVSHSRLSLTVTAALASPRPSTASVFM